MRRSGVVGAGVASSGGSADFAFLIEPVLKTLLEVLKFVLPSRWHLLLLLVECGQAERMCAHGPPERGTSYITIMHTIDTSMRMECRWSTANRYLAHT